MVLVRGAAVAVLLLFSACDQDGSAPQTSALTHTLTWRQELSEIDDCHVFKLDNPTPVDVDRLTVQFPPGSHHVHIYRSDTPDPDGVHDCWSGIDWTRWHLVLGVQTQAMDWQLPDQLSIPFDARQQLLVQVHWLNTSEQPIERDIHLAFHTTEDSQGHVGTVFGVNKQTAMGPHERKAIRQWCPMPDGAQLLALMGHYHGLGTRYAVAARPQDAAPETGTPLYSALDEATFQFQTYEPAVALAKGTGLEFACEYLNTRDVPISWGADTRLSEHCNMSAYYYPAPAGQSSLFCTVESAEVSAIVAPKARVAPGTSPIYTVRFTEPTVGDTTVQLASSDPTALLVPATVAVPDGSTRVTFTARALKTARVTLTATLGTTSKTATTAVGGVVLSEVFLGAEGDSDGRQWVELANLTDEPIDLSGYSLGGGETSYTATRVQLGFTLPARGCAVVGGPALAAMQPAYDQISRFAPAFDLAATGARGVALFDVPADQITTRTLPYDALVYGAEISTLSGPSGQPAPVVARAPSNASYLRVSEARWQHQTAPTPRLCEVH